MTDKVQKILSEIATRKLCTMDEHMAFYNDKAKEDYRFLSDIEEFIKALQEEPVSQDLEEAAWLYYDKNRLPIPPELDLHKELIDFFKAGARWQKSKDESFTVELEEVSKKYSSCIYLEEVLSDDDKEVLKGRLINNFKAGAKWQKERLWKPADGEDLPEFEREVVVFTHNFPDDAGIMRVAIAHRPDPKGWDGKSLSTGKVEHYTPKTYGKGGWNIPDVKYWLDVELPKEIEL